MELKLADGKYTQGNYRTVEQAEELEELSQRIEMKLKVRRGAFVPLTDYGSRLHLLSREKPSNRQSAARQYVLEALSDEKDIELDSLELTLTTDGNAKLALSFIYKGEYTISSETVI